MNKPLSHTIKFNRIGVNIRFNRTGVNLYYNFLKNNAENFLKPIECYMKTLDSALKLVLKN